MKRGGVPLYQAYLSFKELDTDLRNNIAEQSGKILQALPLGEAAIEASKSVWEELKNVKFLVQEATEVFPSEVAELKKFLTAMKDTLSRFARRYRFDLD